MSESVTWDGLRHQTVDTNGLRMHLAEQGAGPAVLLCHGWPESWYSWRHQLRALAAAGYRAIAPDQRGYGGTDAPVNPDAYTQLHLVGDLVGLLDALGLESAVVVGHDWGAPVAWNAALLRPDRFPAVAALSVPLPPRPRIRPTEAMARAAAGQFFYQLYFQTPGVAEAEFERDVRNSLRRILYTLSGDPPPADRWRPVGPDGTFLDGTVNPDRLPAWLTEADLDVYVDQFNRAGFRGGLNWYRAQDLTWELTAAFAGAKVTVPALYIGGEDDRALDIPGLRRALDRLPEAVPNLRDRILLPGCGHWTQQERPAEVNAALIAFLKDLA